MAKSPATGVPSGFLVAPDSFKGTFSASEVAEALRRGLAASGQPGECMPLADGGEGTLSLLAAPLGLEQHRARVSDPLGREIDACFGLGPDRVALVESARASGLGLIAAAQRDPVAASTRGTGELIAAAIDAGARTVRVAVGGSAATDGGQGAVRALLERGGIGDARLVVLCDVRTPFELAAEVFAPQKGASPEQVRLLAARLDELARTAPRDPRGVPMTGAAGGLAGGLWAHFGAELLSGAGFVLDALGYDLAMRRALAVITGEGCLDRQSLDGKLVGEAATRARQAGVPCYGVVGQNRLSLFDQRILDLQRVIEASTLAEIQEAGAEIGARVAARRALGR